MQYNDENLNLILEFKDITKQSIKLKTCVARKEKTEFNEFMYVYVKE